VIAAIALAVTLTGQQVGEAIPIFRDPPDCWDGSQREMNVCASKEYTQADRKMNIQWVQTAALMKRLDADLPSNDVMGRSSQFHALLEGQRAWAIFRDAHCKVLKAGGGSMAPMLRDLCRRDLTKARTEQLHDLMKNPATGNPYFEDQ
jgi:uncharacterized protein YecT (DUF1311 family)